MVVWPWEGGRAPPGGGPRCSHSTTAPLPAPGTPLPCKHWDNLQRALGLCGTGALISGVAGWGLGDPGMVAAQTLSPGSLVGLGTPAQPGFFPPCQGGGPGQGKSQQYPGPGPKHSDLAFHSCPLSDPAPSPSQGLCRSAGRPATSIHVSLCMCGGSHGLCVKAKGPVVSTRLEYLVPCGPSTAPHTPPATPGSLCSSHWATRCPTPQGHSGLPPYHSDLNSRVPPGAPALSPLCQLLCSPYSRHCLNPQKGLFLRLWSVSTGKAISLPMASLIHSTPTQGGGQMAVVGALWGWHLQMAV